MSDLEATNIRNIQHIIHGDMLDVANNIVNAYICFSHLLTKHMPMLKIATLQ